MGRDGDSRKGDAVCVVCPELSTNALGRALLLAELASAHHDVHIAGFLCFGSEVWRPAERSAIPILPRRIKRGADYPLAARWLRRHLLGTKVLVSKPLFTSLGLAVMAGARPQHVLLDNDDWELGMREAYGPQSLRDRGRELMRRDAFNSYASTWAIQRLLPRFPNRVASNRWLADQFGGVILPHVRDTDFLDPARTDVAALRDELDMTGRVWVGFIGTPRRHKGVDDLVDALTQLDGPSAPGLYIAGADDSDPYGAELLASARARLGSERLRVVPSFPFEQLPRWVALADLICLPSRRDPAARGQLPAKVFDAMAMAKPVVATQVNDLSEVLDGCGVMVPPNDVAALRHALSSLAADGAERKRLGERGRQRAVAEYSYEPGRRVLERALADLSPLGKHGMGAA